MGKIKACLVAAIFVVFGASAFAADATVTYVSGKVEVQRNGKWVALQKGDSVSKSETISTGFQSEAKIKIMDSVMYLGPVTRITLEELSSSGKQDNVNVYLKTGSARSQVKHVDNKRVNYQVHTAVAVASCRGTDWIIDDSNNITCFEGMVAVAPYDEATAAAAFSFGAAGGEDGEGGSEGEEEAAAEESAAAESKTSDSGSSTTADTAASDTKAEDTTSRTTTVAATETTVTAKPTSADGVLVRANQSVAVTQTAAVSAPVNLIVTTANKVTAAVSTVAAKESVSSSTAPAAVPAAAEAPAATPTTNKNGTVVVTITIEEDSN